MTSGLANLCQGVSLPPMTVPFNLIDLVLFICLPSALKHLASTDLNNTVSATIISNNTITFQATDWTMVQTFKMFSFLLIYVYY